MDALRETALESWVATVSVNGKTPQAHAHAESFPGALWALW
jgi:hypothetical protein